MKCRPYGDRGLLLTGLKDWQRDSLRASLETQLIDGCTDFVVGYDNILLLGSPVVLKSSVQQLMPHKTATVQGARIDIKVYYDGRDLETVAKACGLKVSEVIELHAAPVYVVRMMGFSPGFPYLDGLDPRLHLERRHSPRNYIQPGSVAIGGPHAGIYSVASPGGWHLLGRTKEPLFNLDAASRPKPEPREVFRFSPGDQVRFHPIDT